MKILKNIRVLDLTRLLPGPLVTLFLADLGAEVIKIEDTDQGDYLRQMSEIDSTRGSLFEALNRDKKGIRLNLKVKQGVEVFKRLSKYADIVVEGFRPGVMDKLGVGYDAISQINPSIIYCSITGYGKDGPYAKKAGHDLNYMGISGVLGVTGTIDKPVIPGVQIGDIGGGSFTAFGSIMLALYNREKTGSGMNIDVSMIDGLLAFMSAYLPYVKNGIKRGDMELIGSVPCYNVYKTKDDKFITIGAIEPKFWAKFVDMISRPDLLDKQYARGDEMKRVCEDIQSVFIKKTRKEWVDFFNGQDVCIEPVNEPDELLNDPQIIYRGMFGYVQTEHGKAITIRNPFYKDKNDDFKKAPASGEHTVELLKSAGYSDKEIEQLKQEGVF